MGSEGPFEYSFRRVMEFSGGSRAAFLAAVLLYFNYSDYADVSKAVSPRAEVIPCTSAKLVRSNMAYGYWWLAGRDRGISRICIRGHDAYYGRYHLYLGRNLSVTSHSCSIFMFGLFRWFTWGRSIYPELISFIRGCTVDWRDRSNCSRIEHASIIMSGCNSTFS